MLELLASDFRMIAQNVLALMVLGAAFIWGKGPERAAAAIWLICFEFAPLVRNLIFGSANQLGNVDAFWASTDLVAGVGWIVIALYANRNYTMWIAGLQVLVIAAHLARGLAEDVSPLGYAIMIAAPGWFQLVILAIGLARHKIRERKFGPYREWRRSRTMSPAFDFTPFPSGFDGAQKLEEQHR